MGNRAIITLEDDHGTRHPVALYVHWNGGLESTLAFVQYTWERFARGRDDLFTFQARLCQVIGNFFPDGLSLYGLPLAKAQDWATQNGIWHFRIGRNGITLPDAPERLEQIRQHPYWTQTPNILETIMKHMPANPADTDAVS